MYSEFGCSIFYIYLSIRPFTYVRTVLLNALFHAVLGFTAVMTYAAVNFFVSCRFVQNTRTLSARCGQNNTTLLNVSLRLAIATNMAVISTVIANIIYSSSAQQPTLVGTAISETLFCIDGLLNSFAVLCSFKHNVREYDWVFGWLHRWCLIQLNPQNTTESAMSQSNECIN